MSLPAGAWLRGCEVRHGQLVGTRPAPLAPSWYEHGIRDEQDLEGVRADIAGNPGRWVEEKGEGEGVG